MSAKELTFFIPASFLSERSLHLLAQELQLTVEIVPPSRGFSFDFFAQKGSGRSRLAIEHRSNDFALIREIMDWTRPSPSYKNILKACKSSLSIYYRDLDTAKDALLKLGVILSGRGSSCLVDNGFGCLLKFDEMLHCIDEKPQWSWEKEDFPELQGVAPAEWR